MAQTIDAELVRHVAKLARIHVSDEQVRRFSQQLGQILHYMQQLNELDVSNVQPLAHARDVNNVFREDQPAASLPVDLALREAPARDGDFFQVPQVLGESEA